MGRGAGVSTSSAPTLLFHLGRALCAGAASPQQLAAIVWPAWSATPETERQQEVRALAEGPAEEAKRAISAAVNAVTPGRSAEERQALATVLAGVVRALRRTGTAPALRQASDLMPFLPAELPNFTIAPQGPAVTLRVTAGPHTGRHFTFAE